MKQYSKTTISVVAAVLIVALTAVYWNHFDNGFHFDDSHTIVNNGYIKDLANLPLIFQDAKTTSSLPTNQAYRPMITSLNAVDHWIGGKLNPKVFHWHIYLEFLLLLVLLYALVLKVLEMASGQKHRMVALLATAFFAFHTATAETINYIIARSDGFSTLMVLVGMLLYISNKGWKKQLGLVPFIIGCLAKPTTLMLAPMLFIYDLLLEQPSFFIKDEKAKVFPKVVDALKGTVSYFVVGASMYFFTRSMFSDTWSPSNVAALDYLNTQPYIFWVYIKTFILPTDLTADTDLTLIKDYFSPKVLWGLLVILILIGVAWRSAKTRKGLPIAFGILWFFVTLAPSSSFVPLAEVMNHHRTFFPYIGLVMALSWACFLVFEKFAINGSSKLVSGVAASLVFVSLGIHAYGTYQRNEVWHDDESLWRDVTIKSPKNGRGLMNYGLTEMRKGNMETAIDYFERALNTNYGRHPYLFINLGVAKNTLANRTNNQKLKKEAEDFLKKAVQMGPGYPDCHYHYGRWLYNNGKPTEAA
ncbi:MAG: tetratricopeptide repeat protein, partial [Flavobacteriales bacterium]|nr:tetratricopeptide repeat protein [Flavobacteriales bacterium]